jgi:S1-C subfamily serine protease
MTEDGLSPSSPAGADYPLQASLPEPPPLHTMAPPPPVGRPRAGRRLAVFALLFLGGAATGSGVAAGLLMARQTAPATASTGATTTNPSGGSSAPSSNSATPSPTPATGTTSTSAIAAKVDPAVVDITATLAVSGGQVAGTGVVITASGEVLTNNHVIEGTSKISVQISGSGPMYTAMVLGTDAADDVALLQIQGVSGLKTVTLGDSSAATVGESVVAIGNALGRGGIPAATQGSITALNQTITAGDSPANTETLNGVIQIDAFIQPGDSGGPLVDTSGRVVGIDTAAQATGRFADAGSHVAFAIPINRAMAIVHQIESGQSSADVQIGARGILGVQVRDASTSGALVSAVESGSPAERAGIAAGDVITSVGGAGVTSASTLHTALQGKHPGDRVTVGWVDASGQQHTATITMEAGPPA